MEQYGVILSGRISGDAGYRTAFALAEYHGRCRWPGRKVWNPALLPQGREYRWYLRQCLDVVLWAPETAVVLMLDGWERSPGAVAERALALAIGLEVVEMGR
jgi:hypothetical protein